MKYALTFALKTARYNVHLATCTASHTNASQNRVDTFETVEAARAYADADEAEKGGGKALWRQCACTKP